MPLSSERFYKGCCMMISRVTWEFPTAESEWIYIGAGDEFDVDRVQKMVHERYEEPEILCIVDRRHADFVPTADAALSVKETLTDKPVILCDRNFLSFMHFDTNGLLRQGRVQFQT